MKVVINSCFGGFGLSEEAIRAVLTRKGVDFWERKSKYALGADFYLCPPEEFDKLQAEAKTRPVEPGRFAKADSVYVSYHDWDRWDPDLVAVVEEMGEEANGRFSRLTVVDIPFEDGEGWYIDEYDGVESINEAHRSWG